MFHNSILWCKKIARITLDFVLLFYGLLHYQLNQKKPLRLRTPQSAYLAMIRLFCVTSGWSNDILSKWFSLFDKPIHLPDYHGILGNYSQNDIKEITSNLETNGYYIFPQKLPQEIIAQLYEFALHQECIPRPLDNATSNTPLPPRQYDRNNLIASVYDFSAEASMNNVNVQALLSDHSVLGVAQSYLKSSPKIDPIAFWWSTPFTRTPQINSAQLFHFDMDRIKWLKFFFFLTDVTIENGPHVFISKSHRTGAIPRSLLKAGYARHNDEEVFKHFPPEDVKTFTIPKGTILAEDTRGLHKGTPLIQGERLVLELQFSNSQFGAITQIIENITFQDKKLLTLAQLQPELFKLYPI